MIRQESKSNSVGITRRDIVVATSFLLLLAAMGCGKEEKRVSATTGDARGEAVAAAPASAAARGTVGQAALASGAAVLEEGAVQGEASSGVPAAEDNAALPPEVVVSVPDSLAVPGSIVEVTAEASSDVTGITLSDGRGQTRPFAYDSTADVWRASYRVPLRSATERLGLSATATNGGNRWKRVWIFLDVLPKQTTARADSGEGS